MRPLLAAGLWVALAACPSAFQAHDAESEVRRRLDAVAAQGLSLRTAEREVRLPRLELSEVEVRTAPLQVMFHVSATGTLGAESLGYYGSESLTARTPAELDVRLPKLEGVLAALDARDRAVEARNAAALVALTAPGYRDGALTAKDLPGLLAASGPPEAPRTVSVRVDGDRAEVTLIVVAGDAAGDGGLAVDGGPAVRPHALSLVKIGDSWRFSSGLL